MISAVFDAVVFVRALLNPGGQWAQLVFERAGEYRLVVSPPIVAEIVGVLARPELSRRFSALLGRDAAAVRQLLAEADSVPLQEDTVPQISRDRKDDKYPATAAIAAADYLVTEDLDLLILRAYDGVQIVDADAFLRLLDVLAPA